MYANDTFRAIDFVVEQDSSTEIVAVNFSLGHGAGGNMSFTSVCDNYNSGEAIWNKELRKLVEAKIIPVAATGNSANQRDYNGGIQSPACQSSVFSVGALEDNSSPTLAVFSNHNFLVDITAPGTNINSSVFPTASDPAKMRKASGTSAAAPMVTGAFAILRQVYPDVSPDDLKLLLVSMSAKTVSTRQGSSESVAVKPVLDFSGMPACGPVPPTPLSWYVFPDLMPELPRTGFSAKAETALRQQPLSVRYGQTGLTVMIPVLSVESDVLTVPFTENEYPVEWLGSSVGMLEGSAEPGKGVMVFTGHNHLNNTEFGPFAALGSLNSGDRIILRDGSGSLYTYTVFSNEPVKADDIAGFEKLANQKANSVTLLTCEEEQQQGGYAYRRVISAGFDGTMK